MNTPRRVVAVFGASGFVGRHVAVALKERGVPVHTLSAPRVRTAARARSSVAEAVETMPDIVAALRESIADADVVVNSAGLADAGATDSDDLFGANALLPALIARAVSHERAHRFVQVSSSAVQGRVERLDESRKVAPFSPYSRSKALGEAVLEGFPEAVVYRATSVHGRDRPTTRRLRGFAASSWASVAGAGDRATPQVLVQNVASGVAYVATADAPPPGVVLHPSEGLTTASLLTVLGGRQPRHVPLPLARGLVGLGASGGRLSPRLASTARRLEMLWMGQDQDAGWLATTEWLAPAGHDAWEELQ